MQAHQLTRPDGWRLDNKKAAFYCPRWLNPRTGQRHEKTALQAAVNHDNGSDYTLVDYHMQAPSANIILSMCAMKSIQKND